MNIKYIVKSTIDGFLNKNKLLSETWYHGTPDSRDLEKSGGFINKTKSVDYISNLKDYNENQFEMNQARENGDEDKYFDLLDNVSEYKKNYRFNSPVFLTDNYSVAKSYADPKRAFDYQGAIERVKMSYCTMFQKQDNQHMNVFMIIY